MVANSSLPMNDPLLQDQWHYQNDGTLAYSKKGADINLFKALEITHGSPNVIVAIVDGGIDINHEDLAANIWINTAEKNGTSGKDDDGNGYKDDVYGWNFVDNSATIVPHSHGTHVAGTVAAVNNNGKGVCGVAGGSGHGDGVRLMSCQIFTPNTERITVPLFLRTAGDFNIRIETIPAWTELPGQLLIISSIMPV